MKKTSKLLALAVVVCLCLSLGAFAASGEASGEVAAAVDISSAGIRTDAEYFDGRVTGRGVSDFNITAENKNITGIYASAEPGANAVTISDGRIELAEAGTAISVGESTDLTVDNVVIWNIGKADGISAAGDSTLLVKNSVIYGEQNPKTFRRASPFALGLAGSMRVTNAVGNSVVEYNDSVIVSGSWAPLSTDSGSEVQLTTHNVLAGIGWLEVAEEGKEYTATKTVEGVTYGFTLGDSANYNSGYVSYCDSGFHNFYYDSELYGTDYVIILSTSDSSAYMENNLCYSDRIGIMWHKNAGGLVEMTGGSMYAGQALFMMKCYSDLDTDGCYCDLIVDGTDLTVGEGGVLLQLMTSDDCGLNYEALQVPEVESDFSQVECLLGTMVQETYQEGFPPTTYYVYELADGTTTGVTEADRESFLAANPDAEPVMVEYEPEQTPTALFRDVDVTGDVYNAVWQAYQAVDVTFDASSITGVISSAWANHVDAEGNVLPGGTVIEADSTLDAHMGMGRVKNTAAPAVNNPVYLTLENGAVWNVTGTSYLAKLTIDDTSAIEGAVMTVNGVETTIETGSYEGEIVLTPANGGLAVAEFDGELYVRPEDVMELLGA